MANLLNAVWAGYISLVAINTPTNCPENGCPIPLFTFLPTVLLVVAIILIIDAGVCFIGFKAGFTIGAILSAATIVLVGAQWGRFGNFGASVSVALSIIALVLDFISSRSGKRIPEESHPLNLPVFG